MVARDLYHSPSMVLRQAKTSGHLGKLGGRVGR